MFNRGYLVWYGLLTAVALTASLAPMVITGNAGAASILVALLISLAVAPMLLWLLQKLGYPVSQPVRCPRCGTQMPLFRKPSSLEQGLRGGYTCSKCGTRMNAAGKELP